MTETERKTTRHFALTDDQRRSLAENSLDGGQMLDSAFNLGVEAALAAVRVGEPTEEQIDRAVSAYKAHSEIDIATDRESAWCRACRLVIWRLDVEGANARRVLDVHTMRVALAAAGVTPQAASEGGVIRTPQWPDGCALTVGELADPDHGHIDCDKPAPSPEREKLITGLRIAMLGTTDGGFISDDSDIPAGEMFRLAAEYLESVAALASPVEPVTVDEATGTPFSFTDDEWRAYQAIPDQGYSHRRYIEQVVNNRLRGDRSE